jgi:hypothetical protein
MNTNTITFSPSAFAYFMIFTLLAAFCVGLEWGKGNRWTAAVIGVVCVLFAALRRRPPLDAAAAHGRLNRIPEIRA